MTMFERVLTKDCRMQVLCSIISFVMSMAGISTIIGYVSAGWRIAVGLALVVVVSFAHASSLAPESLGRGRSKIPLRAVAANDS